MSDLKKLIEEGTRLLNRAKPVEVTHFLPEAKPVVKSVEVTHFPPEEDNPLTHKSHVRYSHGKNTHHYELYTMENPKDGSHTVHKTSPDGEPLKGANGKYEPPLHLQKISRKDFKTHGGHTLHTLLVKNFTDRLHPAEPNRKD